MAHLAQAAQAWLPTDIPGTKQRILDLLAQVAATGANPILELRQGMSWWFGSDAPAMLPPMHLGSERPLVPGVIALEPLAVLRPPTLWPQRPKRFPDELFTSWLWRASVAAAAPAAAFARDVLGTEYDDADREIAPQIVQRLAQLSGQNFDHLAAGTLPARPQAAQDTIAGMAEDVMLRHEGLLVAQAQAGGERPREAAPAILPALRGRRPSTLLPAALAVRSRGRLPGASLPAAGSLLAVRRADRAAPPACGHRAAALRLLRCGALPRARDRCQRRGPAAGQPGSHVVLPRGTGSGRPAPRSPGSSCRPICAGHVARYPRDGRCETAAGHGPRLVRGTGGSPPRHAATDAGGGSASSRAHAPQAATPASHPSGGCFQQRGVDERPRAPRRRRHRGAAAIHDTPP